eukprot:scaffold33980_cov71-Phaeocystis_antarctica.AAC.1
MSRYSRARVRVRVRAGFKVRVRACRVSTCPTLGRRPRVRLRSIKLTSLLQGSLSGERGVLVPVAGLQPNGKTLGNMSGLLVFEQALGPSDKSGCSCYVFLRRPGRVRTGVSPESYFLNWFAFKTNQDKLYF